MLILAVKVEGHVGKFGMHRATCSASGRVRSENRVAECDGIARPRPAAGYPPRTTSAGTMKKRPSYTGTMDNAGRDAGTRGWLDVANHVLRAGAFKMPTAPAQAVHSGLERQMGGASGAAR